MQEQTKEEITNIPAISTSAIVIANPTSGSYTQNKQQIEETIDYLRVHHWQVELKLTQAAGDAQRLAREAAEQQLDVVVAVGGDGTLNEVIQGLAGSQTALGVLPSGTVNVWARETGIPLDSTQARDILVHGRRHRIDLGRFNNERYFLLMAGIGLSGEVTQEIEHHSAKRLGVLSYILIGLRFALGFPGFQVILQLGQRAMRVRATEVVIGNTQLYAGAVKFTWRARADDGLLDVCVVREQNALGLLAMLFDFLLRRPQRRHWVIYETCETIKLHTNKHVAIQVDGDPVGHTTKRGFPPTTFAVVPKALTVIVPQEISEGLLSS